MKLLNIRLIIRALVIALAVAALAASIGAWRAQDHSPLRSLVDVEADMVFVMPIGTTDTLYLACPDPRHASLSVPFEVNPCRDSVIRTVRVPGFVVDCDGSVQTRTPAVDSLLTGADFMAQLQCALARMDTLCAVYAAHSHELDYYARTHSPLDEGYTDVMSYGEAHRVRALLADSARHLLRRALAQGKMLSARRQTTFRVNGQPAIFDQQRPAVGLVKLRFSENSSHLPHRGVSRDVGEWLFGKPSDPLRLTDSLGRHFVLRPLPLEADSAKASGGHVYAGEAFAPDGSYYRGHFDSKFRREGNGFSIDAHLVKYGLWQADKFKGERMRYTAERVYGIDISRYQHELKHPVKQRVTRRGKGGRTLTRIVKTKKVGINWDALRITSLGPKSGAEDAHVDFPVDFVFIKCTQGTTIRSDYYATDLNAALRRNIPVAPYHFFSHTTGGAAQARHFLRYAQLSRATLPPMLDVEPSEAQIAAMGGEQALWREMLVWLRAVERSGRRRPVLYVSQTFVTRHLAHAPAELLAYDVWIARYGEFRPYVKLLLWQLTPHGRIRGIEGEVDINVFNGSREDFQRWCKGG